MGWQIEEDGLGVVNSRDIPMLARNEFVDAFRKFLSGNGLTLDRIDGFPGGTKVLDALEKAFGLRPGGLEQARSVLRDYLFVLERALQAGDHGRMLLSALGPDFTVAFQTLDAP